MGLCVLADDFESLDRACSYLEQYGNLTKVENLNRPATRIRIFLGQVTRKCEPSEDGDRIVLFMKQVTRLGVENEELRIVVAGPLVKAIVDNKVEVNHLLALVNPMPFRCPDYQCLSVAPDTNVTWVFQNGELMTQLMLRSSAVPADALSEISEENADDSFRTVRSMDSSMEEVSEQRRTPVGPSTSTPRRKPRRSLPEELEVKEMSAGPSVPVTPSKESPCCSGINKSTAEKVGDKGPLTRKENAARQLTKEAMVVIQLMKESAAVGLSRVPVTSTPIVSPIIERRQQEFEQSLTKSGIMEAEPISHCSSCSSASSSSSNSRAQHPRLKELPSHSNGSVRKSPRSRRNPSAGPPRRPGLRSGPLHELSPGIPSRPPRESSNFKKFSRSMRARPIKDSPSSAHSRSDGVSALPPLLRSGTKLREPRKKKILLRSGKRDDYFPSPESSSKSSESEAEMQDVTRRSSSRIAKKRKL